VGWAGLDTGALPRRLAWLTIAAGALYVLEAVVPSVAMVLILVHTAWSVWLGIVLYRMRADG